MSAVIQRDQVQGIEIGAGMWLGILVFAISVAFVGMNGYHMSNYLIAKLTTADSGFMEITWWKIVGFGIAALEIPLGMSFITNYRLYKWKNTGVVAQFALALLVAALAAGAGIGSQNADAEARNNQITSHDTAISGYTFQAKAAEALRDKRVLAADAIQDENARAVAKLNAEQKYQQTMANISTTTSDKQSKKPLKVTEDGSVFQIIIFALLSIVASIGAFFLSCFHATYIKQLVALIAFSLKSKADHDWESDASDFKSKKHVLSPLNKDESGVLFKEKVPAEVVKEPAPLASPERKEAARIAHKEEDKSTESVHVECPACEAVFSVEKRLMVPTAGNPKGLLRCGECSKTFFGVVNITDKPAPKFTRHVTPKTTPETPTQANNEPSANSQESEITSKFPANSSQIRDGKQDVTFVRNSSGISQEFAGNSTGITGGANSQGSSVGNSQEEVRHFDLSSIVGIDDADEKMKALEKEIDARSNDPESDGVRFSSTAIFKALGVGYPRVQKIFEAKKAEGKISTTKPFRIIYTGGA